MNGKCYSTWQNMKLFCTYKNGSREQQINRFCKTLEAEGKCAFEAIGVNDCKLAMLAIAEACKKHRIEVEFQSARRPYYDVTIAMVSGVVKIVRRKKKLPLDFMAVKSKVG